MPSPQPSKVPASGGIQVGDVGGSVTFSALGDIVGGDKIVHITTTIQISVEAVTQRPLITTSPYRGLERFDDRDKELFFGRDQLIKSLLAQLGTSNVLLVLGPSGSGKSSVVRAGLLPSLSRLLGARFRSFTLVPDVNPFESLRSSLQKDFSQAQTRDLADVQPGALPKLIRTLQREGEQWLLFVDQFEEIFTRCAEPPRASFIEALLAIAREPAGSTKLVLAMRADFLDHFSAFPPFARLIEKNIILITEMHADELRLAIEQPAAQHGIVFEQGLVEEIIKDVQGQPGSLPLLQYTLDALWEEERRNEGLADRHLNTRAYRDLGGVRGALQKRADEIYAGFGEPNDSKRMSEKQAILRRVFLRSVDVLSLGTDGSVWRPVRRRIAMANFNVAHEQEVLQALIDQKLLVSNCEGTVATVEVAHEALFTSWHRLKKWIEDAKEVIFVANRLADDAARWHLRRGADAKGAEEELLTGSRLAQALEMHARGDFLTVVGGLSEIETRYLDASTALRDRRRAEEQARQQRELMQAQALAREQQRRALIFKRSLTAVAAVLLLAIGAAFIAYNKSVEASRQRGVILARQLAGQAELTRDQQADLIERSVLLAAEATKRLPLLEASQSLRKSLALLCPPLALVTHRDSVTCLGFSPSGKYLATASEDGTARVWEIAGGREILSVAHGERVNAIAFSPNGRYLATCGGDDSTTIMLSGTAVRTPAQIPDNTARVWEIPTGREVASLPHRSVVATVAFNSTGTYLATGDSEGFARVWELNTGHEIVELAHRDGSVGQLIFSSDDKYLATQSRNAAFIWEWMNQQFVARFAHDTNRTSYEMSGIALSADGKYLATASFDSTARVWDVSIQREIARITHKARVTGVDISKDGKYLASASEDATARVLEIPTARETARLQHEAGVQCVSFGLDGAHVITGSNDRTARVWEITTGREVARMPHGGGVNAVAISPDGKHLATRCSERTSDSSRLYGKGVQIWEMASGVEIARMTHDAGINAIAFSPDGKSVATAGSDATARIWNSTTGSEIKRLARSKEALALAFSSNGKYLATAQTDKTVRLWDFVDSRESHVISTGNIITVVAFSPDSRSLATASVKDKSVGVWDAISGGKIQRFDHRDGVTAVSFSPNGKYLATASRDDTARVWALTSGRELSRMEHNDWVTAITFSPESRYVASAGGSSWDIRRGQTRDNTARVWEAETGREILRVSHGGTVWDVAFSPDGRNLATASDDQSVRIWDVSRRREIARLPHEASIGRVVFSPDGTFLATGGNLFSQSKNNTVRIWVVATGQEVGRITHEAGINAFCFSPDGKYIATAGGDKEARVSLWLPADLVQKACASLTRNLTYEEWQQNFADEPYCKTCTNLPVHPSLLAAGRSLARNGDISGSVAVFQRALQLEPELGFVPKSEARRLEAVEKGDKLLEQGEGLIRQNQATEGILALKAATEAYAIARKLGPTPEITVRAWGQLCWLGSLWGNPSDFTACCEQALALEPENVLIRDSRGLARARTGNVKGAIEDFQSFVDGVDDDAKRAQRQKWIEALRSGKNPFTPEELQKVRAMDNPATSSAGAR